MITGEWLCAPLDTEQGGVNDHRVFAEGSWETAEIASEACQSGFDASATAISGATVILSFPYGDGGSAESPRRSM